MRLNNLGDLSPVLGPGLGESGIVISELAVLAGRHPKRKSSRVGFGIYVGAGTDQEVEAEFFRKGHNRLKVVRTVLEVEGSWGSFVVAPAVVDAEGIETGRFDLL